MSLSITEMLMGIFGGVGGIIFALSIVYYITPNIWDFLFENNAILPLIIFLSVIILTVIIVFWNMFRKDEQKYRNVQEDLN